MSDLLSDFHYHWDEGFSMPVANSENKELENLISKKNKQLASVENQVNIINDRIKAILDHMRNVRQELQATQGLVKAKEHEIETEKHMKEIAEREEGRIQQELRRLQKENAQLAERRSAYENSIFRQTKQLEELKRQMNWDKQALEAWLEESARRGEDSLALEKYTRLDEAKIKELGLRTEKLTEKLNNKKRNLDNEMTETMSAQVELDKTAEEFRKAHEDRQELIRQWELTIDQMQRRDGEMEQLAVELATLKHELRNREEQIKEKERFLENEVRNNNELERKISMNERNAAKFRLELQESETMRRQFSDELEALKRSVERTALELEQTRSYVGKLKKDIDEKKKKLQDAGAVKEKLEVQLKDTRDSKLSAEEKAAKMDQMLLDEEEAQKRKETLLRQLRKAQFKTMKKLQDVLTEVRGLEVNTQGSRSTVRNLNSKIGKLDMDSLKQQEILYTQDFAIQQLERRIQHMQGEHNDEEKIKFEAKIVELTDVLEEKNGTHTLLSGQLKSLQDDIRRLKRDMEKSGKEKATFTGRLEELDLHNETAAKELKKVINQKQDRVVDFNLLKLSIKRLREQMNRKADEVFDQEKRKLQLDSSIKERQKELQIHNEMMTTQLRTAEQERSQISAELHERMGKIDKLRKRYEILMVSMAPPEGEEEKSQAYYVIKAAQEKEELQRKGDDLDAKIRKAEKEIRALENTLRLINSRNEICRKGFSTVSEGSEEMEERASMEEKLRAVMDKYKYKRRQVREIHQDLSSMSGTLETLLRDETAYREMVEEKKGKVENTRIELKEQEAKVDRATKQRMRYLREIRGAKKGTQGKPEEKDVDVRFLRDCNKNILTQLGRLSVQNSELGSALQLRLKEANIPFGDMMRVASSDSHSSCSSKQSSIRSSRSVRSNTGSEGNYAGRGNNECQGPSTVRIDFNDDISARGSQQNSARSSISKSDISFNG